MYEVCVTTFKYKSQVKRWEKPGLRLVKFLKQEYNQPKKNDELRKVRVEAVLLNIFPLSLNLLFSSILFDIFGK